VISRAKQQLAFFLLCPIGRTGKINRGNGMGKGATLAPFGSRPDGQQPAGDDPLQRRCAPTSHFIDRKGIIRAMTRGPLTDATLQQKFAQL
jgi:hypothetical protein